VDDQTILRAAAVVMGHGGPARLTLAAVADEVGLVPATLLQRFGSKHGLLLALSRQAAADADERARRARAEHGTKLAALAGLATARMALVSSPQTYANHLAFLCQDLTDPELHPPALAAHQAYSQAIHELLQEAVTAGELVPGAGPAALTRSVQAAIAGAGLTWALEREGTLAARVAAEITAVLVAWLPPGVTPERAGLVPRVDSAPGPGEDA
jgi:AcrR family transcriptional regulator